MKKTNIKITIFAFIVLLGGIFPLRQVFASSITVENVINLVNQEREKSGVDPLQESANLSRIAEDKAEDMLANNYFAHTSPSGTTPWHWFEKEGYDYQFAGENLAINFTSAEKQNAAFMESQTHRKNILGQQFNEIGVAVREGIINGHKTIITVQEFGNRGFVLAAVNKKNNAEEIQNNNSENNKPVLIRSSFKSNIGNFLEKYNKKMFFLLAYIWVITFIFFVVGKISKFELVSKIRDFHEHFFGKKKGHLRSGKAIHLPIVIVKDNGIYLHHMKQKE